MDYFSKTRKLGNDDLSWNIPERKQGIVNVVGGNSKNFESEVRISEYLGQKYPIEKLSTVLPDALKSELPPLDNFVFLSSTNSGSFMAADEMLATLNSGEYNLLFGDLSKNSVTGKEVARACEEAEKPVLITRDAVDIVADNMGTGLLLNENLILMASMPQLIKILRAAYYPKMLLLSQPLLQVVEVLHKFTLSYPVAIVTLHNEQVLISKNGVVRAIALSQIGCSPIGFWHGEKAADILALNLYNPNQFINATVTALMK